MNFQGLDALSTKEDVKEIFPNSRTERAISCREGQVVDSHPERDTLCGRLEVDGYEVNGVDYRLTFLFNTDGTLALINMMQTFGAPREGESHVSGRILRSIFRSLSQLYRTKYGDPVQDWPPANGRVTEARGAIDGEFLWQPSAGSNFRADVDQITVRISGREGSRAGHYWATIQVFYNFAPRSQLNRI